MAQPRQGRVALARVDGMKPASPSSKRGVMARMKVTLSDTLVEELRQLVPLRQRSEFIEGAVRKKLDLLRQRRVVEAAAGAWASEYGIEPDREIRKLRRGWVDPIVAEVRAVREALFAEAGYDIHEYFRRLREKQETSGHPIVKRPGDVDPT